MSHNTSVDDLINRFNLLAHHGSTLGTRSTGITLLRELRSYKRCKRLDSKTIRLNKLRYRVDLIEKTCSSHMSGDFNLWVKQETSRVTATSNGKSEAEHRRMRNYDDAITWAKSLETLAASIKTAADSDDFDDWVMVGYNEGCVRTALAKFEG